MAAFKAELQPSRNTEESTSGWPEPHHNELTNPLNIYLIRLARWGERGRGRQRKRERAFNLTYKG